MDIKNKSGIRSKGGFTLIELLVVVGIIVVVALVVTYTLNPHGLITQGQDGNRVAGIGTLDKAIALYYSDAVTNPASLNMGSSSVIYISIPDPTATTTAGTNCAGVGVSAPGITYHCAAPSNYLKVDGTGWVPINFTSYPGGSVMSKLPIDPINTTSSGEYYRYVTNGTQYEVLANAATAKNASNTSDFAKGTDTSLISTVSYTTSTLSFTGNLTGYCGFAQFVFDPHTNDMWASNYYCNTTTPGAYKINDSTFALTPIPVSAYAQYDINMVFDSHTNTMWLIDSNAKTATIINDTTLATSTVSVGTYPVGIAFDSHTNTMWVANNTTSTVTLVNDTTLATTSIAIGSGPYVLAFDPHTNTMWASRTGGTTVFNDTTYATTNIAGTTYGPYTMAFDPHTNTMWLVDSNAAVATIINDTTYATTSIPTGLNLQGITFDPHTNSIWGGTRSSTIIQINDTTYAITSYIGADNNYDPTTFDPHTNAIWAAGNITKGALLVPNQ